MYISPFWGGFILGFVVGFVLGITIIVGLALRYKDKEDKNKTSKKFNQRTENCSIYSQLSS